MAEKNTVLRVEMLGGFAIISNGRRITDHGKKDPKIWRLIQYLIVNRIRTVPHKELLEVFCSDGDKDNPGSNLYTMVYRASAMLAEEGLECAPEIITARSGYYSWNNRFECTVDIEEAEELAKKAAAAGVDEEERLALLLRVVEMYKGDFLEGTAGEMWIMPLVRHYRSLYIDAVHEALKLLMKHGRVKDAEELSAKALGIDPFDEFFIISYMRTLLAQNKRSEARKVYKKTETMFFDELGVDFSEDIHALYGEISQPEASEGTPLKEVIMEWLSDADYSNVYYCDSSNFKVLCQVEARSAPRSGHTTFVIRFHTRHEPAPKLAAGDGGVMKNLEHAITSCLRSSDIFTRYGPDQYMVMLRSLTYEDCKMLVDKILHKVDAGYLPEIIETSILHVTGNEYANVSAGAAKAQ